MLPLTGNTSKRFFGSPAISSELFRTSLKYFNLHASCTAQMRWCEHLRLKTRDVVSPKSQKNLSYCRTYLDYALRDAWWWFTLWYTQDLFPRNGKRRNYFQSHARQCAGFLICWETTFRRQSLFFGLNLTTEGHVWALKNYIARNFRLCGCFPWFREACCDRKLAKSD